MSASIDWLFQMPRCLLSKNGDHGPHYVCQSDAALICLLGCNAALFVAQTALRDIPAGEELQQSYVPLKWPLADRRAKLSEEYGFLCQCDR